MKTALTAILLTACVLHIALWETARGARLRHGASEISAFAALMEAWFALSWYITLWARRQRENAQDAVLRAPVGTARSARPRLRAINW